MLGVHELHARSVGVLERLQDAPELEVVEHDHVLRLDSNLVRFLGVAPVETPCATALRAAPCP